MALKDKLQNLFNGDYPGIDTFIQEIIVPIMGSDIEYIRTDLATKPEYADKATKAGIKKLVYVADIAEQNYSSQNIALFDVTLDNSVNVERARVNIQQLIRSVVGYYNHILIVFHYEDPTEQAWRFSYAHKIDSQANTTSAKRYTYVFGRDFRGRTAADRFQKLADSPKRDENFEEAFSVQALSDEFFDLYRAYYAAFVEYLTGEKYTDEKKLNTIIGKWDWLQNDNSNQFTTTFDGNAKEVRDYIKKMFGRIVFLYFLQRKGWLYDSDGNADSRYMRHLFDGAGELKNTFLDDVLELLFFYVLNTKPEHRVSEATLAHKDIAILPGWEKIPFLNGGLFSQDDIDPKRCVFPAVYFDELFRFLDSYNFTIDENDQEDAEVGIDPEMLGRIFENLLEDNKDKGAFYTPKEIVDYMCRESIIAYLQDDKFSEKGNELIRLFIETLNIDLLDTKQRDYIEDRLLKVKICDPAIGSGAFPMGLVNLLSKIFIVLRTYKSIDQAKMKRYIMEQSIYGVDIEQGAVDIARLRFWLAMVVEEITPQPLPNLHFKIMQGNSLVESYKGLDLSSLMNPEPGRLDYITEEGRKQLRSSLAYFFNESNHDNRTKRLVEIKNIVTNMVYNANSNINMTELDSSANDQFFMWHTWFADVFDNGGFDIVIGNPPYIDSETMTQLGLTDQREYISSTYKYISGNWDMYMAFLEKGIAISKCVMCYITPDKWLSKPFGKKFRKFCMKNQLKSIVHAGSKVFESATVDAIITLFLPSSDSINGFVFNLDKELEKRGTIYTSSLKDPYLIDSIFSENASLIQKIDKNSEFCTSSFVKCEGACSTGDAYKLVPLIQNDEFTPSYRLVNTGTLDKFSNRWGKKEIVYLTKELGYRPLTPFVSIAEFEGVFGKAYIAKAKGPKIILKGLNLLDAFVDEEGIFLPGKTTLVINNSNVDLLYFISAILNSTFAIFYLKTKYSSSSYCGGITFTKDMIDGLPIPSMTKDDMRFFNKLAKKATVRRSDNPSADISDIITLIDEKLYHLYGLTYDEVLIVDPGTPITREQYESFNLNNLID